VNGGVLKLNHMIIGKCCGCDSWNSSLRRGDWYIGNRSYCSLANEARDAAQWNWWGRLHACPRFWRNI
jgi:hypothetical protein